MNEQEIRKYVPEGYRWNAVWIKPAGLFQLMKNDLGYIIMYSKDKFILKKDEEVLLNIPLINPYELNHMVYTLFGFDLFVFFLEDSPIKHGEMSRTTIQVCREDVIKDTKVFMEYSNRTRSIRVLRARDSWDSVEEVEETEKLLQMFRELNTKIKETYDKEAI